jgi:hypothetical protein
MRTALLIAALLLSSCDKSADLKPCPKEADDAVLDAIFPRMKPTYNSAYSAAEMSHGELDAWQGRINCLRPWAAGLKDPCQQVAAKHWLDFYQGQLNECRDIVRRGTSELEQRQAEYEKRQALERQNVAVYCQKNPVPEPPQWRWDSAKENDAEGLQWRDRSEGWLRPLA